MGGSRKIRIEPWERIEQREVDGELCWLAIGPDGDALHLGDDEEEAEAIALAELARRGPDYPRWWWDWSI